VQTARSMQEEGLLSLAIVSSGPPAK
jgi:hypothetical protein